MAVGNAVLDVVLDEDFLAGVRHKALLLKQRLAEITDRHGSVIEEVRGEGMLVGLKCKIPSGKLIEALLAENMLSIGAGDNVVRLLPPLIVSEAEIAEACEKISAACTTLHSELTAQEFA